MPELKKKIPTVWKGIWKKEIASQGTTSCKQLGCTYICSSYESICEHYSQCNFTPQEVYHILQFLQYFKVIKYINKKCFYLFQNFICKICKFFADSKDKIIDHITEAHSGKEDLDKHSDFEKDEADEDSSEEDIIKFDVKKKYRSSKQTQINSDGTSMFNRHINYIISIVILFEYIRTSKKTLVHLICYKINTMLILQIL